MENMTFGAYLEKQNYSKAFCDEFIVPMFAVICTCTRESTLAYPAARIAEFVLSMSIKGSNVHRAYGDGCRDVARLLLTGIDDVRCGVTIQSIDTTADGTGVDVVLADGSVDTFDDVVIATQANHALRLLKAPTPEEEAHLKCIEYEASDIALHHDIGHMPERKVCIFERNTEEEYKRETSFHVHEWCRRLMRNVQMFRLGCGWDGMVGGGCRCDGCTRASGHR